MAIVVPNQINYIQHKEEFDHCDYNQLKLVPVEYITKCIESDSILDPNKYQWQKPTEKGKKFLQNIEIF